MSASESIYDTLKDSGCTLDSHESDLYVLADERAMALLRAAGEDFKLFKSQRDGKTWAELPFRFAPWWRKRGCRA